MFFTFSASWRSRDHIRARDANLGRASEWLAGIELSRINPARPALLSSSSF